MWRPENIKTMLSLGFMKNNRWFDKIMSAITVDLKDVILFRGRSPTKLVPLAGNQVPQAYVAEQVRSTQLVEDIAFLCAETKLD